MGSFPDQSFVVLHVATNILHSLHVATAWSPAALRLHGQVYPRVPQWEIPVTRMQVRRAAAGYGADPQPV